MSRLIGKDGKINKKAVRWYRAYFEKIKAKGIELHICMYHWEAPEQVARHGILDAHFPELYLRHVKAVLEYFSDIADYFIPMNEQWSMCFVPFYWGVHPPGNTGLHLFFRSAFQMLRLQGEAVRLISDYEPKKKIGIINIHFPSYIQRQHVNNPAFLKARTVADYLTNYLYSDPVYFGKIDSDFVSQFKKYFPNTFKDDIASAQVGDQLDYYGMNYYNCQFIRPARVPLTYEWITPEGALTNSLGWPISVEPIYPDGLCDGLVGFTQRYRPFGLKRLMVTENGMPMYSNDHILNGVPQDDMRVFYITQHLKQIEKAITKGALVNGYFLWTLLDNYEWAEGYKPSSAFGIVAVNFKTGARTAKKSYYWYQNFLHTFYAK